MNKKTITSMLLCATLCATAQTAREEIKDNIYLSGSNYLDYNHQLSSTPLTATPKGYEPFYISHYAYLPAYGTYSQKHLIDFTSMNEPLGGWQKLSGTAVIKGFDGTGSLERYRSKSNGKSVKLYDGVTFNSTKSNYYFYYPGYGMNTNNDFEAEIEVQQGDIVGLSYLIGADGSVYQASDSLVNFCMADGDNASVLLPMQGNSNYYIYRTLTVFTPQKTVDVKPVNKHSGNNIDYYLTLQGQGISKPRSGVYIKNRKKIIIY